MFKHLLDIIYPVSCAVCGVPSEKHICNKCRSAITLHPAIECCSVCGKIMMEVAAAGLVASTCTQCRRTPPRFDMARSAATFTGTVRTLIHKFKYNRATWLRQELAELLQGCMIANFSKEKIDIMCPVPLSTSKEKSRGYNQAGLLAENLSRSAAVPNVPQVLQRKRDTQTQTFLDAKERRKNVADAFFSPKEMFPWVYGRCVLIIDDVMTTGATLSECAATLKANGAERVLAITIARD
jgi:competence protein ComFC